MLLASGATSFQKIALYYNKHSWFLGSKLDSSKDGIREMPLKKKSIGYEISVWYKYRAK
jgi:hypothetical protein